MYRKANKDQFFIESFFLPFGGKLDSNNRWVKLAEITPWEKIEEYYLKSMNADQGREAISARIAFGAISLRKSESLSDEDTVRYIQENPYVQYYLGLHEFHPEPLFDSSMMVHFRKRFPVEFIAKVNECIATGKWPEENRDIDRNDKNDGTGSGGSGDHDEAEEQGDEKNSGTLILDATVAPADIKYPTDIDLLNKCREYLENAIRRIWSYVPHESQKHMLPYNRRNARRAFLDIAKSKKWTKKKLHEGIGTQLDYIEKATKRLEELQKLFPEWEKRLPKWLLDRLAVVPMVCAQQKEMYDCGTHYCENRIVSFEQPHVRPIVRGKRPEPTEFGQKIHLSVVNGYAFIEQTSWDNFNEGTDLRSAVEEYRRRFGCYPDAVLADRIYQTKSNRKYCKTKHIRLSGPKLGRPPEDAEKLQDNQKQMYQDACERNIVEGKNGTAKRRYGLNLIMSKLSETSKTDAALAIMMMNAWKRVCEILLRYLFGFPDFYLLLSAQ